MPFQSIPQIILTHFNWSLARLKEAIENESTKYHRSAALDRFRLTYDAALKTIRAIAKKQGQTFSGDEACFQWVEGKQWLKKGADWNVMQANYKKVQNRPEDKEADKIYHELKTYYVLLNHLSECMKSEEQ